MLRASVVLLWTVTLPAADLILHHGRVVTVNQQFAIAEAVAVKDGRIAAVGTNAEILRLKKPGTTLVDLAGKMVLPGLIDSHVHSTGASMYEFDHPIPDMESIAGVLAYVRARAAALAPGEWITLSQVFITRLREQRYPTRQELDQAAPRNPVCFRTGPDAALNSLALKTQRHRPRASRGRGPPGKNRAGPENRRTHRHRAQRGETGGGARKRTHAHHGRPSPASQDALIRLQLGGDHQHR